MVMSFTLNYSFEIALIQSRGTGSNNKDCIRVICLKSLSKKSSRYPQDLWVLIMARFLIIQRRNVNYLVDNRND